MAEVELQVKNCRGQRIMGTLHEHATEKRVILICHGIMGHRNYLFFKNLRTGPKLPFSTFRFDFHGNGKSDGELTYAGYDEDLDDLRAVAAAMRARGLTVYGVLGHSRGAGSALRFASLAADGLEPAVPRVIAVSARFVMADLPKKHTSEQLEALARTGSFQWGKAGVKGKGCVVTQAEVAKITAMRWEGVAAKIPAETRVLLCHGTADVTVPHEPNVTEFAGRIASNEVRLLEGADHFFRNEHGTQLAAVIEDWVVQTTAEVAARL